MAHKSKNLQSENAKLRQEIRSLQSALKDINHDESPSNTWKVSYSNKRNEKSPLVSRERRERLRREIEDKLDRGIFSPPKSPVTIKNKPKQEQIIESLPLVKQDVGTDTMHFIASFGPPKTREIYKEEIQVEENPSFQESDYLNVEKTSEPNNSIHAEIGKLKDSVEDIYNSLESIDKDMLQESTKSLQSSQVRWNPVYKQEDEKMIKDSFNSYYSEEESKKQSLKEEELSTSRKNEKSLISEIEALRQENNALRQQLANTSRENTRKKKKTRKRSTSNNSTIKETAVIQNLQENEKKSTTSRRAAIIKKSTTPKRSKSPKLSKDEPPQKLVTLPRRERATTPKKPKEIHTSLDDGEMHTPKSKRRNISCYLKSPKINIGRSASVHSFTNFPLTPTRLRHCPTCDHLLSKGYSTVHCAKHGFATSKSPRSLSNRSRHDN
ncbi:unnamed protein product [Blepharisma stoltei]|uniref:Uncharacterized protein n=1 Tax=Blepharisma stoltei TaxID=1481888 RepID=A0AAU9K1L8_9CILI|nr:unnamed protein product [Blepharisma stoltei]